MGCYNWYQSKSFENILGLVGSELIDVFVVICCVFNVKSVWFCLTKRLIFNSCNVAYPSYGC